MKKQFFIIAVMLTAFSCQNDQEVTNKANEIKTTDVLMTIESGQSSGELSGVVNVDRPSSVLDWISTIDVEADHVGTIGSPYSVSETFNMVSDGSGLDNFILEDVALGENNFYAYAKSTNQTPATEYAWISGEADDPFSWVDAQRERVPNANFVGHDNGVTIYGNPSAGQNVVNFDMKAESGRLIVAIRLSEEIRNGMYGSNYVVVSYRVGGGAWSGPQYFNPNHKDDLLTFYFSDNNESITGTCVEFKFDICDDNPGATNTFIEEVCIENGKSIGCIYEVGYESVITDVDDINFTFDWQEVDCVDCSDSDYVTILAEPLSIWGDIIPTMCGWNAGGVVDATASYWGNVTDGEFARSTMTDGSTTSDVFQLKNGSNVDLDYVVTTNQGTIQGTISANSWYLVKGMPGAVITNVKFFDGATEVWNKGGTSTLGTEFCGN